MFYSMIHKHTLLYHIACVPMYPCGGPHWDNYPIIYEGDTVPMWPVHDVPMYPLGAMLENHARHGSQIEDMYTEHFKKTPHTDPF